MATDCRPLVVHLLHRFDVGGLENGVVNLINRMPEQAYRHRVLALTEVTSFRQRLRRADVDCIALGKQPGHGAWEYPRLVRLLRQWRPAVVHTRNLGPLEMQVAAALAGVPARVHGEHGRELDDLNGDNRRYQWVRRVYSPFVHRYVALSRDLERYLVERVGLSPRRITQIYNGVDDTLFSPSTAGPIPLPGAPPRGADECWIGTVGRMQGVKNQTLLAQAFVHAVALDPAIRSKLRLVMVGDGPLLAACRTILDDAGLGDRSWLPGERSDVADVMRGLDCFVLPSRAEGISNTILEAMASGLPVIATDVGGNPELVEDRTTGRIVPAGEVEPLAQAMLAFARDSAMRKACGDAGRQRVERSFSLRAMVAAYQQLYDEQLRAAGYVQEGN